MEIKDLNGHILKVADLSAAIQQAKDFLHNRHADYEHQQLDKYLHRYWSDIYRQLVLLKKNNKNKNEHHGNN